MKKLLAVSGILLLGATTLAWAAEDTKWSGFYVGFNSGLARHEPNWTDNDYDWFGGTLTDVYNTILPGVMLGFNIQNGSIVFGFEADGALGFKENEIDYDMDSTPPPSYWVTKTDKLKMLITFRGRMGFAIDSALFFLTAGFGLPSVSHSWIEYMDAADSWEEFNVSKLGIVVGLGAEYRLASNFAMRAEFLSFKNTPFIQPNDQTKPHHMAIDETIEILRIGVIVLF